MLVILVILLLIFGAGKLTGVGSALGRSIREFREASKDDDESPAATTERAREAGTNEPARS